MFGRGKKPIDKPAAEPAQPLKEAVREARIEAAERSAVVVDLRDAELARLELLNEALDPTFKDIPDGVESVRPRRQQGRRAAAVDRRGRACRDGPRQAAIPFRAGHPLWPRGDRRDLRGSRHGRGGHPLRGAPPGRARARAGRRCLVRPGGRRQDRALPERSRQRWGLFWTFVFGFIGGAAALFVLALLNQPHP